MKIVIGFPLNVNYQWIKIEKQKNNSFLNPFHSASLLADTFPRSERNSIFLVFVTGYDGAITNLMFLK